MVGEITVVVDVGGIRCRRTEPTMPRAGGAAGTEATNNTGVRARDGARDDFGVLVAAYRSALAMVVSTNLA